MSVKIMGLVWDLQIPREEKFILLAYADHADHEGGSIFPAISTIADKTGYNERSVQRITRQLENNGYLIAAGGQAGGDGITPNWSIPVKGDKIAPIKKGDKLSSKRVTGATKKGDIAVSPDPSLTINKQPSEELNGASADTGRPKSKKALGKKRDPLLDHPAIIAYRDEARLQVPITWREKVCDVVDDSDRWKILVHDWIGYGWNKQNIKGMLEAYTNGGIKNSTNKDEPAGFAGIRDYIQEEMNDGE